MVSGGTTLIARTGYPAETFRSPTIYNPWLEQKDIGAVVVLMGVKAEDYAQNFESICRSTNLCGALATMPHRVTTVEPTDEVIPAVHIAGAYNAVLKHDDRTLSGDQLNGTGFMRGALRKGRQLKGVRVLLSGVGGVGSAIVALLVAMEVSELTLYDTRAESAEVLDRRLLEHHPALAVHTGSSDPDGFDTVVSTMPVGMKEGDPLPFDVTRIALSCFVGEVVVKSEYTPLLRVAFDKGCGVQVGTDILFKMVPAYLRSFGFSTTIAEELRYSAATAY